MTENEKQILVTFEEVLNSDYWHQELHAVMGLILSERRTRPTPPAGFWYKHDVIDAMRRDNLFTPDFINKHIRQVWEKKSGLSSSVRKVVLYVGNESFRKAAKEVMEDKKNSLLLTLPNTTKKRTANGNKKTAKSVGTTQRAKTKNQTTNQVD